MRAITVARTALIVVGIGLLGVGALALITEVPTTRFPGIAAWLVGSLVLHDGVAAMTVLVVSLFVRRIDARVPLPAILIAQGALVLVVIVTVLVVPEIVKASIGSANPSILPLDYARNLVLFNAIVVVLAAAASTAVVLRRRGSAPERRSASTGR